MVFRRSVLRSIQLGALLTASVVVAGCTSGGGAGLVTTAIVGLPSGFHVDRPTDKAAVTRATAMPRAAMVELATLRLEGAHRRAVAALVDTIPSAATGGFVCQIEMGTAPLD